MRRLPLAFGLLLLAGCFDPPVQESVRLRFFPNGAVAVTDTVALDLQKDGESNPALERRMSELRRELLEGTDPWARRFASVEPVAERLSWEKRFGVLATARRSALIAEAEALRNLFGDTSVAVSYSIAEDGTAELTLVPGVPAQATRKQRKDMERAVDEWSGHVAEYLAATGELYAWLEDNPGSVRPVFREMFREELTIVEEAEAEERELSAEEMRRVERVGDAMEKVLDVLLIPRGQDRSLDELSHLVYDPFPAPLSIQLPEDPLEIEGFEKSGEEEKVWTVDSPGLWTALRSLEGSWVSPDPVMIYMAHRKTELDLDELVETPRTFAQPMPDGLEVRRAIEERLQPASSIYRAVWKALRPSEADDEEFSWPG